MSVHGLCEQALRDCEHKLAVAEANQRSALSAYDSAVDAYADVQSEVTWWRERMREQAEEWRTRAARLADDAGHQPLNEHGRHQQTLLTGYSRALVACADQLGARVTEAETGRNGTATPGGHDGTTDRGWAPPPTCWTR